MWNGYTTRLASPAAPAGPAIPGAESAAQLVGALEGAGDYSVRKRVYGLVRWTYDTLQKSGLPLRNECKEVEKLFMPDFRPEHEMLGRSWADRMTEEARASCSGWKSVRLAAIVMLLCETALKNSELVELRLENLRGTPPRWLNAGHKAKEREFVLSAKASALMTEWLAVRPAVPTDFLFVADATGRCMDHATLWRQLKRVTLAAQGSEGVRHFGTGLIRATKARELKDMGTDVAEIADFLGHMQEASTGELLDRVRTRRAGREAAPSR
ncbi:Tyrosine recombinase XerC [Variovorax sp. B4]|nr:Tyrosine recombinase XerC [Variovorax sp. B2]PNG50863.1 Tyrosine recombinase XerC [Variovorax sp. B4]VTU41653.1 site-specific tyrosine recombinase XerC [Variovorax sp. PBL-H6]VTU44646.1 site-specific tyrosine recombinase XerC [Variovorax sp. SRS16]VTU44694.1 site-specific tyrosine recombinase XerC [Variovorax sp. PBL-E5]